MIANLQSSMDAFEKPRVLFWPLGNPELETAQNDADNAFSNLARGSLNLTPVHEMTWWEPSKIPSIQRSIEKQSGKKYFDSVVIFSATHGTVRCIAAIVKRMKIPAVIWAIPTRYSLATSGLAASYLNERGYFTRLLCNLPDDSTVVPEIETVARASHARREMGTKKIGIIGNLSPLMISLPYDPVMLRKKLGPSLVKISLARLDRVLSDISQEEIRKQCAEIKQRFNVNIGNGTLEKAAHFQLAVRRIVKYYKLDGIALECWTNLFSKYGVNPCLGHLDNLDIGCEGDVVSLSGSLILKSINGISPYLADILSVNEKENLIELSHCSAPVSLASLSDPKSKVTIGERTDPKSKGKTAFANFRLRNGPVTLVRFFGRNLDKIHMTSGRLKETGEFWGGIKPIIESGGNAHDFLRNISGNHYLLTYGDIRNELYLFGELNHLSIRED